MLCCALLPHKPTHQMFGAEAPPLPWDEDKEYSRERVQLYYLSNAGQQLQQVRIDSVVLVLVMLALLL